MKIFEALKKGEELTTPFVARELLKFHLNLSMTEILLKINENLDHPHRYFLLLKRYEDGEPLEYITSKASFLDSEFFIKKGVLIPRFETEILVKKVYEVAKNFTNPKICEIGFGSGIISLSLKKMLPNSNITATDISKTAFEVANINAKKLNLDVNFINTSYLDGIDDSFDIIVSNPPYIKNSYKLDKWVLNEPKEALFGGVKGYEILEHIINLSKDKTRILACEIGYDQKRSLSKILKENGFEAKFYKDLAGFDRVFLASNSNLFKDGFDEL